MLQKFVLVVLFFVLASSTSSSAQGWRWAVGSSGQHEATAVQSMTKDKNGNIYAAVWVFTNMPLSMHSSYGPFIVADSGNTGQQGVLVSVNSGGNFRWAVGTQYGYVKILYVAADTLDNIYAVGYTNDTAFSFGGVKCTSALPYTWFCAKLRTNGSVTWIKPVPFDINALSVSKDGNIYLAGMFLDSVTLGTTTLVTHGGYDAVVAKYDASFSPVWATNIGAERLEATQALTVADNGDVCLAGIFESNHLIIGHDTLDRSLGIANFVAKLDSTGNLVWGRGLSIFKIADIYADSRNSFYIGGVYFDSVSTSGYPLPSTSWHNRMFFAKYDSAGIVRFATTVPDTTLWSVTGIDGDNCGNIWVSGSGGYSPGSTDPMFMAHYDTVGNLIDTVFVHHGGNSISDIVVDGMGRAYIGGLYADSLLLAKDTLRTGISNHEVFFAKYRYSMRICEPLPSDTKTLAIASKEVLVYPNPASDICTFYCADGFSFGSRVEIYDLTGRLLSTNELSGKTVSISVAALPDGLYQCRVLSQSGSCTTKKLAIIR